MPLEMDLRISKVADVDRGLNSFAKAAGVTVDFVCADQMRLWTQDLMGPKVTVPKNRAQGRKKVADDVEDILAPIPPRVRAERWTGNATDHLFESPSGAVWLGEMGVAADIPRHHRKSRRPNGETYPYPGNHKYGKLTKVRKLHVRQSDYRRFRAQQQSHVGRLKAGWITAVTLMARGARTTARYPAWLNRAPHTPGSGRLMHGGHGYVEATNPVPYAADKYESWLSVTRMKRHADIIGSMWRKGRMERVVAQFNSGGKL